MKDNLPTHLSDLACDIALCDVTVMPFMYHGLSGDDIPAAARLPRRVLGVNGSVITLEDRNGLDNSIRFDDAKQVRYSGNFLCVYDMSGEQTDEYLVERRSFDPPVDNDHPFDRYIYMIEYSRSVRNGVIYLRDMRGMIDRLASAREKGLENHCAGYAVYALNDDGHPVEALLEWHRDGQETHGYLFDPDDPDHAFAASANDVPVCIEGDELCAFVRLMTKEG